MDNARLTEAQREELLAAMADTLAKFFIQHRASRIERTPGKGPLMRLTSLMGGMEAYEIAADIDASSTCDGSTTTLLGELTSVRLADMGFRPEVVQEWLDQRAADAYHARSAKGSEE